MTSVIIDCDPGHDDALVILLAAKHLNVLGITTVSGNESIEKVTTNALKVVEFGGINAYTGGAWVRKTLKPGGGPRPTFSRPFRYGWGGSSTPYNCPSGRACRGLYY